LKVGLGIRANGVIAIEGRRKLLLLLFLTGIQFLGKWPRYGKDLHYTHAAVGGKVNTWTEVRRRAKMITTGGRETFQAIKALSISRP
jgi:hypothetical protein